MIDQIRYVLGVLNVIVLPSGVLFWLLIHPWARRWRRIGAVRTYVIVLLPVVTLGAALFRFRRGLLGADLGMNRILIAIALILYGVMTVLELQCWRQLSVRTLLGVPEVSGAEHRQGKLLNDGIYRIVRHPRYLSAGIGVVGNALFINHVGMYALILLIFPVGSLVLPFEERELVDRFGEEYRQYQREVPQLLPRWRKAKSRSSARSSRG